MKIIGELKEKLEVQEFGTEDNKFKKQTLIFVETEPEVEYPNTIAIDFSNEKISLAGAMQVGWIYEVNYSVSCKKSDKGVFNTIRGWKIKEVKSADEKQEEEVLPFN